MSWERLPALLTVKQLQEVLSISRTLAYRLCNRKDFPCVRIGKCLRIHRDGLRAWLDEQKER